MCDFCKFVKYQGLGEDTPADEMLLENDVSFGVLGNGEQNLGLWKNADGTISLEAYAAINSADNCINMVVRCRHCPMCGRKLQEGADNV